MRKSQTPGPVGEPASIGIKRYLISVLVRSFIRLLYGTLRIMDAGSRSLDAVESDGGCAILPFFHGRQFPLVPYMAKRKATIMSSLSRDGELQAHILAGFGYRIVRGSASRGGARGLIGMKRGMRDGYHAGLAVDGPKGPIHEVKPGVIYLAKKTGAPVIPVLTSAKPSIVMKKTWDRYMLPVPFAKAVILFGEPIYFDGNMDQGSMERDCRRLRDIMLSLQEEADGMVGLKKGEKARRRSKTKTK